MNIFSRFTLRTLAKNKMRTMVTIIGIALSMAMFTAVTSIVVSFQQYLLRTEIARDGVWEGRMIATDEACAKAISQDKGVKAYTQMNTLGYAKLDKSDNDSKPYLQVEGIDNDFTEYSPISMLEGRMPENASEIVLPKHLDYNGGISYKVGDTLTLKLGRRYLKDASTNEKLDTGNPYTEGETWKAVTQKTYTVVGICDRPVCEDYSSAGYTAFTCKDDSDYLFCDVFLTFYHPGKCDQILEKYTKTGGYTTHGDLLRYQGNSLNDSYNAVLYTMAGILIGIIMIGSISLIYSAFSISLSERTKQFGLLKSIGATKKQIRHSVLFEACVLCVAGIPLGMIAGLGGIGITLHFLSDSMSKMWSSDAADIALYLVVRWQAVLLAALICFITVLISAMIPAVKAVRIPAIQAIRQNRDIQIRSEKVKTSRLTYRLFGFAGMLASKNFKRNKKKYRTTVFSLFISIVLFVSATSFSSYMKKSLEVTPQSQDYEVSCSTYDEETKGKSAGQIAKEMKELRSVDDVVYHKESAISNMELPLSKIDTTYMEYIKKYMPEMINQKEQTLSQQARVYFLEDSVYRNYLKEQGLDVDKYMATDAMTALVWGDCTLSEDGKVVTMSILKDSDFDTNLSYPKEIKDYYYSYEEDGYCYYRSEDSDKEKKIEKQKAVHNYPVHLGQYQIAKKPRSVNIDKWSMYLTIVLPYSAVADNRIEKDTHWMTSVDYCISSGEHEAACTELNNYFDEQSPQMSSSGNTIFDAAADRESEQAIVTVVNVFSYGFIVLISLISIANVFNTISTNILLRRQEFAMLKSVGMTGKGFDRMMNYECALYGLKGLAFGIPVSLVLSYFMYKAVGQGVTVHYLLPWQGILISVVSVFIIVFISMLYAMQKVKKDNPMEAIRNENL